MKMPPTMPANRRSGGRYGPQPVRRALLSLAAFCTAAAAGSAWQEDAAARTAPAKQACTAARATPTSIAEVNGDFSSWRGKCVSIEGLLYDWNLYAGRMATLDERDLTAVALPRSRRLPLNPQKGFRLPKGRPHRVRVTGEVGSCQDAYAWLAQFEREHPQQIVMLGGLCHMTEENYIVPLSLENVGAEPALRLTEAEVPAGQRRIREASPAERAAAEPYVEAANRWLEALAAGDRENILRLEFGEYDEMMEGRRAGHRYDGLEDNFAKAQSDQRDKIGLLSFAKAFRGAQPQRVFIESFPGEPENAADPDAPDYTMCWCKSVHCDGKWPIAPWDADNDPTRPYFCIEGSDFVLFQRGKRIVVSVPLSRTGFAEPVWGTN
jgi:hypothetical protein